MPGAWPSPDPAARAALAEALADVPDGGVVLVDGLIACRGTGGAGAAAARLRLVVLVHMPLGDAPHDERSPAPDGARGAAAAAAVVTTSEWTRDRLRDRYSLRRPAACTSPGPASTQPLAAPAPPTGRALLCVAAVTPHKGHDVLLDALADAHRPALALRVASGPLDRDPGFVDDRRVRPGTTGSATGCASPGR